MLPDTSHIEHSPQTSRQTRSTASQFLWVIKESKCGPPTSHETGQLKSAINRHAQLHSDSYLARSNRARLDSASAAKRIAAESWSAAPTDPPHKHIAQKGTVEVAQQKTSSPKGSAEILVNYGIDVSATDPFDSSAVKLDHFTKKSLQYHLTYSLTSGFRNEKLANDRTDEQHRYFPVLQHVVKECMYDKMHMSALLSAVNTRMLLNQPYDQHLERRANIAMQQGIGQLRKYFLNNPPDVAIDLKVILDVFHLACGEWYRQYLSAATTHLHILRQFIHIMDLSKASHRYAFDMIHFYDVFIALEGGTVPIFPLLWEPADPPRYQLSTIKVELDSIISKPRQRARWRRSTVLTAEDALLMVGPFALIQQHPGHLYAEVLGRNPKGVEQRPGCSFATALSLNVFSPHFARIIRAFIVRIEVATHAHLSGSPSAEHVEWMNKRLVATLHKLAAARPETDDGVLGAKENVRRKVEECFRLGMITYLTYIAAPLPWRIGEASMLRLQKAVRILPADTFSSVQYVGSMEILDRMLIWSLINGIFGAATRETEADWFTIKAAAVAKRLGLKSYEQLHRLMSEFSHSDTLHYAALRRLAKCIDDETM